MGNTRRQPSPTPARRGRPPATPEAQENHMINLSMQLTEKQLRDGTATAQQQLHFLKLATQREHLERQKILSENRLLQARVERLESEQKSEELAAEALAAFRSYTGQDEYDI